MKRNLSPYLFGFAAVLMLSLTGTAKACVPFGGRLPPCATYWGADNVFVGTISVIKKLPFVRGEDPKLLLRFSVEQSFRGSAGNSVEVVARGETDCDPQNLYRKKQKWLVYAYRNSASGKLDLGPRSGSYEGADEDLVYIYGLSKADTRPSIIVGVYEYPNTPLEGIKIEIEAEGFKYQGVTDRDGRLIIPVPEPGKYLIRGVFSDRAYITALQDPPNVKHSSEHMMAEYQREMKSGRCEYIQFVVSTLGKTSTRQ